jgi:alkylation response protein AidB-like acyl-CoA dehydrogenase
VLVLTSIGHCGFALGVARRAMEEVAGIVGAKQRLGAASPVAGLDLFRHDFALQDAALRSARAYSFEVFGDLQATVERGDDPTEEQRHRARQVTTYATKVAEEVVRSAYTWAGTNAIRPGVLQRCFRDLHTATQHVFVDPSTLIQATPVLLPTYQSGSDLSS